MRLSMPFPVPFGLAVLSILALAVPAVSQIRPAVVLERSDSLVVHPDPAVPLAERWRWALDRDLARGFWIAWGVTGPERVAWPHPNRLISSDSPKGDAATAAASSLRERLARSSGIVPPIAFVFGISPMGEVTRIRLRSDEAPIDFAGLPLVWLGPASTRESLAELRRMYAIVEEGLRAEIAAAFTLHEEQEMVIRNVLDVMNDEDDPRVRAEAVQWLPQAQPESDEIVAALLAFAFEDASEDVQLEAVDAIAALESEKARRELVRIAESHPNWKARSEAAQALARRSA